MPNHTHLVDAIDDDESIKIRISHEADPLVAALLPIQVLSQCARGLPAEIEEWDLSNLLINGHPVYRRTVVAWLNRAYQYIYSVDFEAPPAEAAAAAAPKPTAEDLSQLLTFADAIGTRSAFVTALVTHYMDGLVLQAKLGKEQVQLPMFEGTTYYFSSTTAAQLKLYKVGPSSKPAKCIAEASNQEQKVAFCSQIAKQVEELLYLSFRLKLTALLSNLKSFLSISMTSTSLIWSVRDGVFTPRVLDAAACSEEGKKALINSMAGCYLWDMVTRPTINIFSQPRYDEGVLYFDAVLRRRQGAGVEGDLEDQLKTVAVELDLFSKVPKVKIGGRSRLLQLRVGPFEL